MSMVRTYNCMLNGEDALVFQKGALKVLRVYRNQPVVMQETAGKVHDRHLDKRQATM